MEDIYIDTFSLIIIVLSFLFVMISIVLWKKHGMIKHLNKIIEPYPPADCNSSDVAFLYKGYATDSGIISLIIQLANDGYLKIEETDQDDFYFKQKGFKIIKVKEYDGDNEYEKIFFNGLFKRNKRIVTDEDDIEIRKIIESAEKMGETISYEKASNDYLKKLPDEKEKVTLDDLQYNFYSTLSRISTKMNSQKNKTKIFEKKPQKLIRYFILMIILIFSLVTFRLVEIEAIIFYLIFFMPFFGTFIHLIIRNENIGALISGICSAVMWIAMLKMSSQFQTINIIDLTTIIVSFISIAIIIIISKKMMYKRTQYGIEMLEKINGFKTFVETVKINQLENLTSEDPKYFYNMLPYTYALGISKVWMEKFETIDMDAPEWYTSSRTFYIKDFNKFISDTLESLEGAMTSKLGRMNL